MSMSQLPCPSSSKEMVRKVCSLIYKVTNISQRMSSEADILVKCAANHKNEATDAAMNISLEASGKKAKLAG